jgi:thiamine pyrophosphokinase
VILINGLQGTHVVHIVDENTTDFSKCIHYLKAHFRECLSDMTILAMGGSSGRLDHNMGCLNVLYRYRDLRIVLLTEASMTTLLNVGQHELDCTEYVGSICGLIPLSGPVTLTTQGLFWDLKNTLTGFGRLVSTSNRIKQPSVNIITDGPILWTMGLLND